MRPYLVKQAFSLKLKCKADICVYWRGCVSAGGRESAIHWLSQWKAGGGGASCQHKSDHWRTGNLFSQHSHKTDNAELDVLLCLMWSAWNKESRRTGRIARYFNQRKKYKKSWILFSTITWRIASNMKCWGTIHFKTNHLGTSGHWQPHLKVNLSFGSRR